MPDSADQGVVCEPRTEPALALIELPTVDDVTYACLVPAVVR